MRKFISITLTLLLLLNVLGLYGLFVGLHYSNDREMAQKLDNGAYVEEETITLSVPIAVPYHIDQEEFQRVEGTFEHDGQVYRLVKQRLAQDTLYLVCIKDHQSGNINQALKDYVKTFSDKPLDAKHQSKILSTFSKEYSPSYCFVHALSDGWMIEVSMETKTTAWVDSFFASIVHPPERA